MSCTRYMLIAEIQSQDRLAMCFLDSAQEHYFSGGRANLHLVSYGQGHRWKPKLLDGTIFQLDLWYRPST